MYQKTLIVGRVGGDAEMRYTPSGDPVTSFSVAVSRKFRNGGGEQQEVTTWYRVTAWRKLAETCGEYVKKGMLVLVDGSQLESRAWLKDGEARSSLELTADNVRFLSSKNENGGNGGYGGADEDVPF